jgi:hypothetical protein
MPVGEFEVPPLVSELLRQGRWPISRNYAGRPAVARNPFEAIMPGETEIWLSTPPFHTVDSDNLEWFEQFREPGQIDFAKAVIIGDFGPGSDAPIVIDFSSEPAQIKALQITAYPNPLAGRAPWPKGANFCLEGHWVTLASSFEEFVETLNL